MYRNITVVLALVGACVSPVLSAQGEETSRKWVEQARWFLEVPPPGPPRVMPIFPLVEMHSKEGEIGWGKGLIAEHAMWLTSFAPDRLLDTWNLRTKALFTAYQLYGAGRRVTKEKIRGVCLALGTENYTTGELKVSGDAYLARITIHGENGIRKKEYTGSRNELHRLPCLIARDVLDYIGISLSEQQSRTVMTPLLHSTQLFEEVAENYPAFCYFNNDYRRYWALVMGKCRTVWTEYIYLLSCARGHGGWTLKHWGKAGIAPECKSVALDYLEAWIAIETAEWDRRRYDRAGRLLAPLLITDPCNPFVVGDLARALGAVGETELAERAFWRLWFIFGDSFLTHLHYGESLKSYAWDARGTSLAYKVSPEDWRLFDERLRRARSELEKARAMEPRCWEASRALISAAKGLGLPREYVEARLEEVIAQCPTDYLSYSCTLLYFDPRWCGSIQEMLAFGRRCARTGLYNTRIPALLMDAHWRTAWYGPEEWQKQYFTHPEVWNEVEPVLRKTIQKNPHDYQDLTYYLQIAYWADKKEVARELFQRTRCPAPTGTRSHYFNSKIMDNDMYERIEKWINEPQGSNSSQKGEEARGAVEGGKSSAACCVISLLQRFSVQQA